MNIILKDVTKSDAIQQDMSDPALREHIRCIGTDSVASDRIAVITRYYPSARLHDEAVAGPVSGGFGKGQPTLPFCFSRFRAGGAP